MKIAVVQYAGADKATCLERAARSVRAAAREGAQLVCLHELATSIYFCFEENAAHFAQAEPVPGPSTDLLAQVAREERVVVVLPLFERVGACDYYNSAVVIGPTGALLGTYRKTHIPLIRRSAEPATGFEKYYFRPGDLGFPVFPTPFGVNVGVVICFDRHFPEAFRSLALNGAHLACVPTTTMGSRTSPDLWYAQLQVAAFTNGMYVAAANRVGQDVGGRPEPWTGGSVVYGPGGECLARASTEEATTIYAEVDPGRVEEQQAVWGFFRDRIPHAYAQLPSTAARPPELAAARPRG